ncbi:MAG: 5-(carboxyamino)imidazole ribonucleotide synthase [Bacteroidales bacterium]|nr:5-(carboxyamino)imidazole ribonucleotide synthase [Bacteroidales bacterium]
MKHYFSSDFTLGILGGGQLGKMLLYETRKYDIRTAVLDPGAEAPCRIASNRFQQGDLMDYQTVLEFGRQADVITFEIEHVNVDALEALENEGKKIYPSSATLRTVQDKGVQKAFYRSHDLPTAPFVLLKNRQQLHQAVESKRIALPFVWKSTRGGYDGRGVSVVRNQPEILSLPDVECMTEPLVPIEKELAVIVARNPQGQIKTYPVVEMEFHPTANQVEYVLCPARIAPEISEKARAIASRVSDAFNHVGLLAVELFLTGDGDILINEVAPRPHNSGHYTIEGSYTNQFEQHLRAVLGLPLGETESKAAAVMVNLVGEKNHQGAVKYQNIEDIMAMPGVIPHIYGKKETRPFRKMGHVTIINKDVNQARNIAEKVKNIIRVIAD